MAIGMARRIQLDLTDFVPFDGPVKDGDGWRYDATRARVDHTSNTRVYLTVIRADGLKVCQIAKQMRFEMGGLLEQGGVFVLGPKGEQVRIGTYHEIVRPA